MTDFLSVLLGIVLGVLASVPVAMVIAVSTTHGPARSHPDFAGWYPPDEITEETAVTLYFDVTGREVLP